MTFLAIFLGGLLGFVGGSEWIIRRLALPGDAMEAQKLEFATATAPTAAFGDSHVAEGLVSGHEFVNLGHGGEILPMMLAKAEAYALSGRGKRIILQFSPEQFAIYRAARIDSEAADDFFNRSKPWFVFLRPQFRSNLLAYWSSILRQPWRLFQTTNTTTGATTLAAPEFVTLPADERRRSAEIRAQLHAPLPADSPAVKALLAQLSSSLDLFRQRNIQTCLVEYPVTSDYRNAAAKIETFATLRARFRDLAASTGARLVELADSLPDESFGDADHIHVSFRPHTTKLVLEKCFATSGS